MRTYWLLVAYLGIAPVISHAQSSSQLDLCESVSQANEVIMTGRQGGVSMPEMMKYAAEAKQQDGRVGEFLEWLTITAYKLPRYKDASEQQGSIQGFRDASYVSCIKRTLRSE